MRVLMVWFVTIISAFAITIGWYICNGVILTIAHQALGDISGEGLSVLRLLEFIAAWWGPLYDIVIVFWAIINSQEKDPLGYLR